MHNWFTNEKLLSNDQPYEPDGNKSNIVRIQLCCFCSVQIERFTFLHSFNLYTLQLALMQMHSLMLAHNRCTGNDTVTPFSHASHIALTRKWDENKKMQLFACFVQCRLYDALAARFNVINMLFEYAAVVFVLMRKMIRLKMEVKWWVW